MVNINIELLEEIISVDKKMNAEHYATGYFKELGWKVYFSKKINSEDRKLRRKYSGGYIPKLVEIAFLYDKYPKLKECIQDSLGVPDLVVFKDGKFKFIEVKTNSDGLSGDQLNWMGKHNDVDIVVFYLKQNIIEK